MLTAATSAYGYHETWNGWYTTGTLYYNNNAYSWSNPGLSASDSTIGSRDTFYQSGTWGTMPFVCDAIDDTIYLVVNSFTGGKPTGESGTKDGAGTWAGGYLIASTRSSGSISGTWSATFDYTQVTPSYSGTWTRTASSPDNITGGGTSSGTRTARW